MSIDGYHKTLLDIINCQNSGFKRKSVVLVLFKIKQYIVLDNAQDGGGGGTSGVYSRID